MTVMIMGQVLAKFFHFLPTSLSSCLHIFSYSCLRDTHHFLPQQFLMLFTPCWRNSFLHSWLPWWESVSIFAFGWLLCKNACCSLPSVNRIVKSCDTEGSRRLLRSGHPNLSLIRGAREVVTAHNVRVQTPNSWLFLYIMVN